jgi:internalin A
LRSLNLWETKVTGATLNELAPLSQLRLLNLNQTKVGKLTGLSHLKALRELELSDTAVNDDDLRELNGLKDLRTLNLRYTKVTDAGLKELAALTRLQTLRLDGTAVSDAGLTSLTGLNQLQLLTVPGRVTDAAIRNLQQEMPQVTVWPSRPPYTM